MSEKTTIEVTCMVCDRPQRIKANEVDFYSWHEGELIQNAMPYLTPGERELLISKTCEPCFHKMFASE